MPNIIIKSEERIKQENIVKLMFSPPKNVSQAEINEASAIVVARTREAYQSQREMR